MYVLLGKLCIQRIVVWVDDSVVAALPQIESGLNWPTFKLLTDLLSGNDTLPKPLKEYARSMDFDRMSYRFHNELVKDQFQLNPMTSRGTGSEGAIGTAGIQQVSLSLGEYLVRQGLVPRYLVGSRSMRIVVTFLPASLRKINCLFQHPASANNDTASPLITNQAVRNQDQIFLGNTLFSEYKHIQDSRGALYNDLQLLARTAGNKNLQHRYKWYGDTSTDPITVPGTQTLRITLPTRSPPRWIIMILHDFPNLPGTTDVNQRDGYTNPWPMYFYRPQNASIDFSVTHAGVPVTRSDISFDGEGVGVKGMYLDFKRLQRQSRFTGTEDADISYRDFLTQFPMFIMAMDSSRSRIVAHNQTGLTNSQVTITWKISQKGPSVISPPATVKLTALCLVDEFIRKRGALGGYEIVTPEEALAGGVLRVGLPFGEQNAGNIARALGITEQIEQMES